MNKSLVNPRILECRFTYGIWYSNIPDLRDLSRI
jgi:hypothetical protein